jgi:O-methyltransferase involved in polyketide biosynthesis
MEKIKPNLSESSETLLISLWSRAQVIEQDTKAKELLNRIEYDFSRFEKWKGPLKYTIARTTIFDKDVRTYLASHPTAVILNIGAGLDARFFRMDNGEIIWYEIDLPAVTRLRRQLMHETERYHFISASLTDEQWVSEIPEKNRPILFIVEGVLMYLKESEVNEFFDLVTNHFPNAEMVCEIAGPFYTKFKHRLIQATSSKPTLPWSIWCVQELEKMNPRLKICAVYEPKEPLSLYISSKIFGLKIAHLQFVP